MDLKKEGEDALNAPLVGPIAELGQSRHERFSLVLEPELLNLYWWEYLLLVCVARPRYQPRIPWDSTSFRGWLL